MKRQEKSTRSKVLKIYPEIFVCTDCLIERGYRWPHDGEPLCKVSSCEYCFKRTVTFAAGDMWPCWEKPLGS